MASVLAHQIAGRVAEAAGQYHRLVLVVGPPKSGKTVAFRALEEKRGWPRINLNLALSERLLELNARQRALRVARILDDVMAEQAGGTLLVDNAEMLFHPELQQDPLRLLQSLSRNRTIVAAWRGRIETGASGIDSLIYATPEHPEYRRFDAPQALIVVAEPTSGPAVHGTDVTEEQTA